MKIQILSDLHTDLGKFKFENPNDAEILILAGDLSNGGFIKNEMLRQNIFNKWKYIIFILGNHEFYTKKFDVIKKWREFAEEHENFIFLHNESIELLGKVFYGGTMWTNNRDPIMQQIAKLNMNDYKYVTLSTVDYMHKEFINNIKDVKPDVIISHHAPCVFSIAERYKTDKLTPLYYEDMSELINLKQPTLWVHGHVHHSNDYQLYNTNIVSNPRGYYKHSGTFENWGFDPHLTKEI